MRLQVDALPKRTRQMAISLGILSTTQKYVRGNLARDLTLPLFDDSILRELQRPLFNADAKDVAIVFDEEVDDLGALTADEIEELDSRWHLESEDTARDLHGILLEQSLRTLAGRGNAAQKLEVLDWVFEPDIYDWALKDGQRVPIWTAQLPLTFLTCCRICRYDPDRIKDELLKSIPRELATRFAN